MKKLLMIALVAFFAVGSGFAQTNDGAKKKGNGEIEALTTALELKKDQVDKLKPILKDSQAKQKEFAAKMKAGGDKAQIKEEKSKLSASTDKSIKAILTPEQAVKFDAYRQQQKAKAKKKQ